MEKFLKEIEETFHQRFHETNRLKHYWKEISSHFPPKLEQVRDQNPHRVLAGQCGDLGLAILWVGSLISVYPVPVKINVPQ